MARLVLPAASSPRTCASRSLSRFGEPSRAPIVRRCAREPRCSVELLEPPSRGFELETAAVLIALPFRDGSQQQGGLRFFVRHLQLAPGLARLPQRCCCRFGVRGRCGEQRRAEAYVRARAHAYSSLRLW